MSNKYLCLAIPDYCHVFCPDCLKDSPRDLPHPFEGYTDEYLEEVDQLDYAEVAE